MSTSRSKAKKSRIRRSPARKDPLFRRFEASVDQDDLAGMLLYSGDARSLRLVEMLFDSAYRNFSLSKLCERAGLSIFDLLDLFRRYKWDIGTLDVYDQLPRIVEEIARDAMSSQGVCRRCKGDGKLSVGEPRERSCPHCEGTGRVRVPGDIKAARLILEITGVIGKNRSPAMEKLLS